MKKFFNGKRTKRFASLALSGALILCQGMSLLADTSMPASSAQLMREETAGEESEDAENTAAESAALEGSIEAAADEAALSAADSEAAEGKKASDADLPKEENVETAAGEESVPTEEESAQTAEESSQTAEESGEKATDAGILLVDDLTVAETQAEPAGVANTLSYEDGDAIFTVSYGEEAGLPADTELTVETYGHDSPSYKNYYAIADSAAKKLEENSAVNFAEFYAVSLSYTDENGEEVTVKPENFDYTVTAEYPDNSAAVADTDTIRGFSFRDKKATALETTADRSEGSLHAVTAVVHGSDIFGVVSTEILDLHTLQFENDDLRISLDYTERSGIPDGAELFVEPIGSEDERYSDSRDRITGELLGGIEYFQLYDISIRKDGGEIEPADKVTVKIVHKDDQTVSAGAEMQILHLGDDGMIDKLSAETNERAVLSPVRRLMSALRRPAATSASLDSGRTDTASGTSGKKKFSTISFRTDSFSLYAEVGVLTTTLETSGGSYTITATFGPEAEIPAGTQLVAKEILSGTEDYQSYLSRSEEQMTDAGISAARFFDISFVRNGKEIEPKSRVSVTITMKDGLAVPDGAEVKAVHFARGNASAGAEEAEPETIAETISGLLSEAAGTVTEFLTGTGESGTDESSADGTGTADAETPEVLDVDAEADGGTISEVSFIQDSFSVTGIVGQNIVTVDYLSADGNTYTVSVDLSDANIPEGAYLQVEELSDDEAEEYIKEAAKAVDTKVKDLLYSKALDISIVYNNEKIQPDGSVKVEIELQDKKNNIHSEVVHFGSKTEVLKSTTKGNTVEFETKGFSVFAIVGTKILKTNYISADGREYSITVTYGPKAKIPNNATLAVREIQKETDEYFTYYNKALRAAGLIIVDPKEYDETSQPTKNTVDVHEMVPFMPDARFFDISILVDGKEFEPKDAVDVKIEYEEPLAMKSDDKVSAIHFTSDGDELVKANVSDSSDKQVITHSQNSFSVTGDVVISMTGDADVNNPGTKTASFQPVRLRADGGKEGPATAKTVTDNRDGTYKIKLDVIGAVESHTKVTKANVIVILDTSGSMDTVVDYNYNTRWDYAKYSINKVASTLLNKNGRDNNPSDLIEMALVTFDTTAQTQVSSTTKASDITSALSRIDPNGGTNWEDALQKAADITFNNDGDATYVIFVSDGNPTFRNTQGAYRQHFNESGYRVNDWSYYETYGVYGFGSDYFNETVRRCYNEARDDAQALVQSGRQFYTIGAFGNVNRMYSLTTESGAPGDHYFSAADPDALSDALDKIAEAITNSIDFQNVSTTDGITSLSSLDAKVSGEATGFKYYKNGKEWANAPKAEYKNSSVVWDLSSENPLEDKATYSVEFDVWPSQAAYDTIADLNNGIISYDTLDDRVKAQINNDGSGVYSLKTNTSLTTTYTKDGVTGTDEWDKGENAMSLDVEKISLEKLWPKNQLDEYGVATYRDADGNEQTAAEITLTLTKAGEKYMDVIVSADKKWKKDDIYISCGLMTVKDGVADIKEHGYDYTITEPSAFSYYWDLIADVYHPMVINGEAKLLVLDESLTSADNETTFKIDGKYYKAVSENNNTLEGSNYRRSNLNITKALDGANAPKDQYFEYTVTVKDADSTDGYVWFSAWDPEARTTVKTTDWVISGATPQTGDTGYWYATNGATVQFKIKAGWNVRFLNLKHDSTFSVEETGVGEGFEFESLEGTTQYSLKSTERWHTDDGAKSTGSIIEPNNSYTITYTNKWKTQEVKLKKVDEKEGLLGGTKFTLSRYNEKSSAENKWEPLNADIAPGATEAENPVTIGNLGIGRYKLHETAAPENYDALPEDKDVYFSIYDNSGTLAIKLTNSEGADLSPARSDVTLEGNVITVSNQRKTTSLKITKTVSGKMGDKTEKFAFTLQLLDYSDETPLSDCTNSKNIESENGKWTFELGHGEDIVFTGIPVGTKFTLKENKTLTQLYDTTYQVGTTDPSKSAPEKVEILDATSVIVNNDRDATVPTGIYTDLNLWRWLIGACFLMFFGSALYGRRKRRQ